MGLLYSLQLFKQNNPRLSDLTRGKFESEKPISRVFGVCFLAYSLAEECECRKLISNRGNVFVLKQHLYGTIFT